MVRIDVAALGTSRSRCELDEHPLPSAGSQRGYGLRTIGAALFWLGFVGAWFWPVSWWVSRWAPVAWGLLSAAVALTGVAMTRRGRKLTAAARGAAALQDDRRAPVVYLRSFSADDESARVVISWALLRPAYDTDEQQLATVLNEIGPFVAIGDPANRSPIRVRRGSMSAAMTGRRGSPISRRAPRWSSCAPVRLRGSGGSLAWCGRRCDRNVCSC